MKKVIGVLLVFLMFLSFFSLFLSSYVFSNEALTLSRENTYEINAVLDASMVLQKEIKSSISFLLLYLAFSVPEHEENYYLSLERAKEGAKNLRSFLRGKEQLKEMDFLDSSLEAFGNAGENLLNIHDDNPEGFVLGEYDDLSKIAIDSSFDMMDSTFQIAKVNIIDYGLGINLISNRIELILASYYWGTGNDKESYFEELENLNESLFKYYNLPKKDQSSVEDIFEEMNDKYDNLDFYASKIIQLVEDGTERSPEDLKVILPFVSSTNDLMDLSNELATRSFPSKLNVIDQIGKFEKLFNYVNWISLGVFMVSFILFLIFYFGRKEGNK